MYKLVPTLFIFVTLVSNAMADTVVANRTIRSHSIVSARDIIITDADTPGSISDPIEVIGLETRVVIYANRPIRPQDVGPPAIIERNQIVTLVFEKGGLRIVAEARSLGRGGVGDTLRVMNLTSKSTVSGIVSANGNIHVNR